MDIGDPAIPLLMHQALRTARRRQHHLLHVHIPTTRFVRLLSMGSFAISLWHELKYLETGSDHCDIFWRHLYSIVNRLFNIQGGTPMTVATSSTLLSKSAVHIVDELLKRYATQLTTALGIFVCITGIM